MSLDDLADQAESGIDMIPSELEEERRSKWFMQSYRKYFDTKTKK